MIELYSGTPGSGKSLHAAQKIKQWLEIIGEPVITNFPFKARVLHERKNGSWLYIPNYKLNPDVLIRFSEEYRKRRHKTVLPEESILLVIDEAQLLFNAREWHKQGVKEWVSFFTQHRKFGYRIILIAQFDMMLDKQIRSVIEYEYIHRKVKNIGKFGFLMNLITGGNLHVCVKMYRPLNMRTESSWFKSDKNLISLYNSYAHFEEKKSDPRVQA